MEHAKQLSSLSHRWKSAVFRTCFCIAGVNILQGDSTGEFRRLFALAACLWTNPGTNSNLKVALFESLIKKKDYINNSSLPLYFSLLNLPIDYFVDTEHCKT